MNVTYEIDWQKDNWNDLFTFNIINKDKCKCKHKHKHHKPKPPFPPPFPPKPFPPKPPHPHHEENSGCKCDPKKTQKEIEKAKTEVLKKVIKLIGEQTDIDINKIVNAVIKKQKPHEDNQTNNINKNQQDINDLNNITIWDKDNHFGG